MWITTKSGPIIQQESGWGGVCVYAKMGGGELTTILIFQVRLKGYVYGELKLTTISCVAEE